jgi:GAF domain-containing protein
MSKSLVMVPLVAGHQARGLITLGDTEHEHAFKESDMHLLQTLANAMSVALENARLFDETQRRSRKQQALEQQAVTSEILTSYLFARQYRSDLDTIAKDAYRLCGGLFGVCIMSRERAG